MATMAPPALDQRLRQVLLAVIAEYVETAQPVGSRSVSRRHVRGLSPATMGVRIVSNKLGNIPSRQTNAQHARTPCSSHPATFFYKA